MRALDKVTALITRTSAHGPQLLLFEHPYAGIQIPAGTVEPDETPAMAALREAREESGLECVIVRMLASHTEQLAADQRLIVHTTKVYARPDRTSFDWAVLRRGLSVAVERAQPGWVQVTYREADQLIDPQYTTYQITGWVPAETVTQQRVRHFFQLRPRSSAPERWEIASDQHHFTLFWANLADLPAIVEPQRHWPELLARP